MKGTVDEDDGEGDVKRISAGTLAYGGKYHP